MRRGAEQSPAAHAAVRCAPFAPHCPCVARICLLIAHSIPSVPLHPRSRSAANRQEHRVGSGGTERTGSASGSGGGWVSVSLSVTTPCTHAHRDGAHTTPLRRGRQWAIDDWKAAAEQWRRATGRREEGNQRARRNGWQSRAFFVRMRRVESLTSQSVQCELLCYHACLHLHGARTRAAARRSESIDRRCAVQSTERSAAPPRSIPLVSRPTTMGPLGCSAGWMTGAISRHG